MEKEYLHQLNMEKIFIKGKWYRDSINDFIKYKSRNKDRIKFTAFVQNGQYCNSENEWNDYYFREVTPMTIDEMKEKLPKEEWWVDNTNEMFPIY